MSLVLNNRAQINKSVVYFTVGRNVKFWCSNAKQCIKFDMKSGLNVIEKLTELGKHCTYTNDDKHM